MAADYREDERLGAIQDEYASKDGELSATYDELINNSDSYYNNLIENSKEWEKTQTDLQNQQTEHTINQINQQKEQANKDYIKEQSASYVDWQKQSNQYGANAEKMAASGLSNTGFSESSQVSMYNTYQNRVATARASFEQAKLNYDNAIKDAQLQNSSILAEIARDAQTKQFELALQGFQYKNNLILEQANKKIELSNTYFNRYMAMLDQINTEKAFDEQIRQFESKQAWDTQQAELDRQHQIALQELKNNFDAQQAELDRQHDKDMLKAQTDAEKELLNKQHAQALEKLKKQYEYDVKLLQEEAALAKGSGVVAGGGSSGSNDLFSNDGLLGRVNGNSNTSNTPKGSTNKLDLGLGPKSDSYYAKLAAAGLITITKGSDGKTYYYNNSGVTMQNADALLKLAGY